MKIEKNKDGIVVPQGDTACNTSGPCESQAKSLLLHFLSHSH